MRDSRWTSGENDERLCEIMGKNAGEGINPPIRGGISIRCWRTAIWREESLNRAAYFSSWNTSVPFHSLIITVKYCRDSYVLAVENWISKGADCVPSLGTAANSVDPAWYRQEDAGMKRGPRPIVFHRGRVIRWEDARGIYFIISGYYLKMLARGNGLVRSCAIVIPGIRAIKAVLRTGLLELW